MDSKVILTDLALCDLREIVDYLEARSGPDIANKVGNTLLDRALEIGCHPQLGHPVAQRPGVRKVLQYSYLIYYEVDEAANTVAILRMWHGARDPKTLRMDG